jgi:hypothetical protein
MARNVLSASGDARFNLIQAKADSQTAAHESLVTSDDSVLPSARIRTEIIGRIGFNL